MMSGILDDAAPSSETKPSSITAALPTPLKHLADFWQVRGILDGEGEHRQII